MAEPGPVDRRAVHAGQRLHHVFPPQIHNGIHRDSEEVGRQARGASERAMTSGRVHLLDAGSHMDPWVVAVYSTGSSMRGSTT